MRRKLLILGLIAVGIAFPIVGYQLGGGKLLSPKSHFSTASVERPPVSIRSQGLPTFCYSPTTSGKQMAQIRRWRELAQASGAEPMERQVAQKFLAEAMADWQAGSSEMVAVSIGEQRIEEKCVPIAAVVPLPIEEKCVPIAAVVPLPIEEKCVPIAAVVPSPIEEKCVPIAAVVPLPIEEESIPCAEPTTDAEAIAAVECLVCGEEATVEVASEALPVQPTRPLSGCCVPTCCPCACGCWGPDLYLGGRAGNWRRGAGAEGFLPLSQNGCSLFFIQGGTGWFHDLYTGNIGAGYRWLTGYNTAFGVNIFYDASGRSGKIYSQIGGGLEILGCWWLARANYYQPIRLRTKRLIDVTQAGIQLFERQAYPGFDAEIGKGIPFCAGELWAFAGYFYYRAHQVDPLHGPRIRGEYRLQSLPFCINGELILGAEVEHDRLHKTTGSASLELRLFLDRCRPRECCRSPICRLMGRRVERERMIRVETAPLMMVGPGPAEGIIFFNNTIDGVGTQTNPALLPNAIAMSGPGDVLFGLQDTGNVPVMTPIPLQPEQQLLGFSNAARIVELSNGMTIVVSDLTGAGQVVLDIAPGMDGVTTTTDNYICGVTLQGGDRGVVMDSASADVEVDDVNFRDLTTAVVNTLGGALTVRNSTFLQAGAITVSGMTDDLLVTNNQWPFGFLPNPGGVSITDPVGTTTATITDNLMPEASVALFSDTGGTVNIERNLMVGPFVTATTVVPRFVVADNDIQPAPLGVMTSLFAVGQADIRINNNQLFATELLFLFPSALPLGSIIVDGNTFTATGVSTDPIDWTIADTPYEITNNTFVGTPLGNEIDLSLSGTSLGLVAGNTFGGASATSILGVFGAGGPELTISSNMFAGSVGPAQLTIAGLSTVVPISCLTVTGNTTALVGPGDILLDNSVGGVTPTFTAFPDPNPAGAGSAMTAANGGMTTAIVGTVPLGPVCTLPVITP
ncbi:MAG: inverse autotransporter beta domain-containing protein [Parachlamydiales bacterium]